MAIDLEVVRRLENVRQTAGMVVVTVAEDQGIGLAGDDVQGRGVRQQSLALAGVEKDPLIVGLDPQGETMFGDKARSRFIIDDNFQVKRGIDHNVLLA
jgi:hypothetical protein